MTPWQHSDNTQPSLNGRHSACGEETTARSFCHRKLAQPGTSAGSKPVQSDGSSGSNEDFTLWARFKRGNLAAPQLRPLRHTVPLAEEATKNLRLRVVTRVGVLAEAFWPTCTTLWAARGGEVTGDRNALARLRSCFSGAI